MKKKLLTIFFLYISIFSYSYSSEKIVNNLKEGGKIVFIRHAIAPGGGDPPQFTLKDCNTQRNLSQDGIDQSKKIGLFFKKNKIKIDNQEIKEILTINGIRFSFEDGSWGLIRASSNKPSLVIVTESPTSDKRKIEIFKFIDKLLQSTGKVGEYDQKI